MYQLIYRERNQGFIELYNEACEDENRGIYFVVNVPTEAEWKEKMPEWAKERRQEIMERIISELETNDFCYPGYVDD